MSQADVANTDQFQAWGTVQREPEKKGRWTFLYDKEQGHFLGRGASSWGKILLFYLIYFAFLAAVFAACLIALHSTILDEKPKLHLGRGQLILTSPGMAHIPMGDVSKKTPTLTFSQSDPASYLEHVDQLRTFLNRTGYTTKGNETVSTCDGQQNTEDCSYNLTALGDCWDDDLESFNFGYDEGNPCILLRTNKIYSWEPETYSSNPDTETIGDRWNENSLPVTCETFKAKKGDLLAEMNATYYPEAGFQTACYPYCSRTSGYLAPLTMVKLADLPRDQDVAIWCRFYAQNSQTDRKQGTSSASFIFHILD